MLQLGIETVWLKLGGLSAESAARAGGHVCWEGAW